MAFTVEIDGVDRTSSVQMGSLTITDNINQAVDTCSFNVLEYGNQTFRPEVGSEIEIFEDATKIYAGILIQVGQSVEADNVYLYDVSCKDTSHFMDRRLVTERYEDTDLQTVVLDLIDRYAADFGFTGTNVGGASVDIKSVSFSGIPLSECLNKLVQLTNYSWYVDYDKDIHLFAKNDEAAPFDLDSGDPGNYIIDSLEVSDDFSQIRNRVKVTGGEGVSDARDELLAGDGETAIFPLANKFSELPTVEVDGTPVTVGVDFLQKDTDYDVMWSYQQKYLKFTAGNIPPAPSGGDATNIVVNGTPLRPIVVQRSDNASIAEYGVYEFAVEKSTITTTDEALQFALSELQTYAEKIRGGRFATYESGLRSGQTITITDLNRGINEDFLIQVVKFQMVTKDRGIWVAEVATVRTLSMIDVLQSLLVKERIVLGADESLLNFFEFSDTFSMLDGLDSTPTETTTEDYVWEQDSGSNYANPIVWDKFTWG